MTAGNIARPDGEYKSGPVLSADGAQKRPIRRYMTIDVGGSVLYFASNTERKRKMDERNPLAVLFAGLFQVVKCIVLAIAWILIIGCAITKNR